MSLSQSAATNVVPVLARLVLAIVFIPAGWNKVATTATFQGEDAAILRSLGVGGGPAGPTAGVGGTSTASSSGSWTRSLTGGGWSLLAAPPSSTEGASPPASGAATAPVVGAPPTGDTSPLNARSLHAITLMVQRHGMAYPVYHAYAAAAAELVGGVLLLVGLFSRLAALAVSGTMAVAFWFTSWPLLAAKGTPLVLFELANPPFADFNRVHVQLALFALAFGVFLAGPGALSLDRLIFGRAAPPAAEA
ncbi:MAG: DoxX family membrane protein [Phycisphaerales bacterium]